MSEKLASGQAHIWYVRPEAVLRQRLLGRYELLLTPEERARKLRFRFEEDRVEYLVTRALVRTVLSRYTDVAPDKWRFRSQPHGAPKVVQPNLATTPRFNLSHTKGLIACLVARDRDVGVDVENATRSVGFLEIADRYFSPREVADIRSLPDSSRRKRFFEYWTLKESIIKAMETSGLSKFSFDLRTDVIRATFGPSVPESPTGWQFLLREISPEHVLAASLRRNNAEQLQIELRETVPLVS